MARPARRSRRTFGALAATALAALLFPGRPAGAAGWSVLGYADVPGFVEPLGPGKALVCASRRCAVWDVATASSTPTDGTLWMSGWVAHARLPDGSVIIVDGSNRDPARIWSPSTGRWRDAATPPEALGRQSRIATLADGRVVLTGEDWAAGRPRAYVADANVRAWTLLAEAPSEPAGSHAVPDLVPVPSGLVLFSYNDGEPPISRYDAATNRWKTVTIDGSTGEHKPRPTVWGDDVVVFTRRDQGWEAIIVGPAGEKRHPLPDGLNDGFVLEQISGAGTEMLFLQAVGKNGKRYVWRRPDETPLEINSAAGASLYSLAAVDDRHVVGLDAAAVRLFSLDDQPDRERPCDGLERYLGGGFGPGPVTKAADPSLPAGFNDTLVSDACREQVRRGEAPQLLALVHGWTARREETWRDLGRTFSCAIQDPAALAAIPDWFAGRGPRVTRYICITSLIDWPNAEVARKKAFAKLVTSDEYGWELEDVLPSVLSSNPSPALRDQLLPVLEEAQRQSVEDKRQGADTGALYRQLCAELDGASAERRTICARGPTGGYQADQSFHFKHPLRDISAVLVIAGLTAGTYAARNTDLGRAMATGSGALGGATVGAVGGLAIAYNRWDSKNAGALIFGGAIVGGLLGGVAAYYASASPSARAPTTAVGLVFPCIFVLLP